MDIPVYLVAGFLDSGKTSFINGILEDGFAREDKTLLICCEEGDEEYEKKALDNVTVVTVDDEDDLTLAFCKEHGIHLDAVNENLPEIVKAFGTDCRKIFANEYWDDRAVLMSEKDIGEFSDGFHTFNSLYHQRLILFAALVNTFPTLAWKSHKHSDGEAPFGGGWFIVGVDTPKGPYTYHYEDKDWGLFHCKEVDTAPEWDGHTDKDVERVLSLSDDESDWAAREVALASQKEREGAEDKDDWDYGVACYESALRAYRSLERDGHSGMSIQITKSILNRLIPSSQQSTKSASTFIT